MSIALVQEQGQVVNVSSPVAISFSGPSTAGNLLTLQGHLVCTSSGNSISAITDNGGNTWTFTTSAVLNQNPPYAVSTTGANFQSFAAWSLNAAPASTVTLTIGALTFWNVVLAEWSGASAEDTGAAVETNAIGAGLSLSVSPSLSESGELVLLSSDTSNNWTSGPAALTAYASGHSPFVGYALNQSSSPTYTWSGATNSTDGATIAVAAFLPTGGVVTPPVVLQRFQRVARVPFRAGKL